MITPRLQKLFRKASELPPDLQDALADEFLLAIENEKRWNRTFAKSQKTLDRLADKARKDYRDGKTVEMGWDEI